MDNTRPPLDKLSSDQLAVRLNAGDAEAWEQLQERWWKRIRNRAYKWVDDERIAEDCAQGVMLKLWKEKAEKKRIIPTTGFDMWFNTFIRNHICDVWRSKVKWERFPVPVPKGKKKDKDDLQGFCNELRATPDKKSEGLSRAEPSSGDDDPLDNVAVDSTDDVESRIDYNGIKQLLRALGPEAAFIVNMKHFEGYTFKEITELVNIKRTSRGESPAKSKGVQTTYYRSIKRLGRGVRGCP